MGTVTCGGRRTGLGWLLTQHIRLPLFTHMPASNSPESKYTRRPKSDMSTSLSKDLLSVLIQLKCILCFAIMLQCSLLLLKPATWTNPSRNLDWRLRVAMLGAKVAFHLCSFMELDGWTKRHLSRLQGGSVCYHLSGLLRNRTAGCCFSGVTKVPEKRYQVSLCKTAEKFVSVYLLMGSG